MSRRMVLLIASVIPVFVMTLILGIRAVNLSAPIAQTNSTMIQPIAASNIVANLPADQAARIAQNAAPNSKMSTAPELVNAQGTLAYEVKFNNGNIYIDANTGAVLANSIVAANTATTLGTQRRSGEHSEINGEHHD